jgi:hypothetical protein
MSIKSLRAQKQWDIEKLILKKVEGNGLVGAASDYHILGIPHQSMNEFIIPNSFTF